MEKRIFWAAVLTLLGSMALAQHAVEPGAAPTAETEPPAHTAAPVPQPAPPTKVALPSELDLYVVPAATREVCTTSEWGYGEVRTECRAKPIPLSREDPALRGICITRYGHRTCY